MTRPRTCHGCVHLFARVDAVCETTWYCRWHGGMLSVDTLPTPMATDCYERDVAHYGPMQEEDEHARANT